MCLFVYIKITNNFATIDKTINYEHNYSAKDVANRYHDMSVCSSTVIKPY